MSTVSGESGHPCLFLILEKKHPAFRCSFMTRAVGFMMLRYLPSVPTVLSVFVSGC